MLLNRILFATIAILSSTYSVVKCEDVIYETLKSVREQVIRLEEEGKITRNYQPYFQDRIRDEEVYDFIIVGAGTSGSALTRRLTEVNQWKVLLLEAGGEPDLLSEISFWSTLTYATRLNWNYTTEPQPNFGLGFKNQRISWHRGKGIGGTSLLNFMVFSRGIREDYDKWAAQGNPGWSYEDVLPYFKKLESVHFKHPDVPYRGFHGPVSVEDNYVTKSGEVFIQAAKNSGYSYVDYNGRDNHGTSFLQGIHKRGKRCSGELCYLRPIKNKRNLTIRINSHVTKILIRDKKAYGVEYYNGGIKFKAYASKEIISSAGAINSAQLLLLSGIGPTEQLTGVGIQPILNLPVGKRIKDHTGYMGLGFIYNQSITFNSNAASTDGAVKEFYNKGKGILTSVGALEALSFVTTSVAPSNKTDIEYIYGSTFVSDDLYLGIAGLIGIDPVLFEQIYRSNTGNPTGLCFPMVMHPESYGHMELRSSNPFEYPKLYGGYFTDPEGKDMKTMIAGIRECIRVNLSPPFDKYNVTLIQQPVLGCGNPEKDSDEYWECAVRHLTTTVWHQTESCKMGPRSDPQAVVDNKFRVHGIRALRVVDTSVIPLSITGHPTVPAYMMGEKAADIIKDKYLRH